MPLPHLACCSALANTCNVLTKDTDFPEYNKIGWVIPVRNVMPVFGIAELISVDTVCFLQIDNIISDKVCGVGDWHLTPCLALPILLNPEKSVL